MYIYLQVSLLLIYAVLFKGHTVWGMWRTTSFTSPCVITYYLFYHPSRFLSRLYDSTDDNVQARVLVDTFFLSRTRRKLQKL